VLLRHGLVRRGSDGPAAHATGLRRPDNDVVADCCDPRGYDKEFGDKFARQMERKYRRGGLDDTAEWMVDYFSRDGLEGVRALEIGGGVGEIGIELAVRGART